MNVKNIRLAFISVITAGFVFVFFSDYPGLTSVGSSLFDFSKGMMTGMSLVATAAWLYFLAVEIRSSYKAGGIVSTIKSNKPIFSFLMFSLLAGTIVTVYKSNNSILLVSCSFIISANYAIYLFSKTFSLNKFCNKIRGISP
ncbi:MAG: hypothetical protein WB996_09525 [Ignavibacteriaceae bacterium]